MTDLVEEIRSAWGWTGLNPIAVVGENPFGNLIVEDANGAYWRICPEDVYCKVIASDRAVLDRLSKDQEFLHDWYMNELVEAAEQVIGPLADGRKYCLVTPGLLGGAYDVSNIKSVPLVELVRFSGDIGRQIRDLPDGAEVELRVVE